MYSKNLQKNAKCRNVLNNKEQHLLQEKNPTNHQIQQPMQKKREMPDRAASFMCEQ